MRKFLGIHISVFHYLGDSNTVRIYDETRLTSPPKGVGAVRKLRRNNSVYMYQVFIRSNACVTNFNKLKVLVAAFQLALDFIL